MKKIIFSLSFFIWTASPAWAEEGVVVDVYTQAEEEITSIMPSKPPLEAVEVVVEVEPRVIIPVIQPIAAQTLQIPQLNREEIASLHLDLIRSHVEKTKSAGLFGGLFSSKQKFNDTLLQDIDIFFQLYPDLELSAEALFLRGKLYAKQRDVEQAAIAWLQVLFEFPNSEMTTNARQRLVDLLANDWDDYAQQISPLLDYQATGDSAFRLNTLLNKLYDIEDKKLAKALLSLQASFLKRFPQSSHADEVQVLMGHNLGSISAESGVYAFKKLLALYAHSAYRTESMLAIADLQRLRLKEYDNAAHGYKILIEDYPTHPLTKHAYQNLALTLQKHLKNYGEAIAVYTSIVALYPEDKMALPALQTIAKLQEKKTGQPRDAVDTLRKLATMFSGEEAVQALEHAIKIAKKKLKDQTLLMEVQEQLVRDFPASRAAPLALFEMAKFAEKELKDENQALSLYQQFVQQYPEHKKAAEARKHL